MRCLSGAVLLTPLALVGALGWIGFSESEQSAKLKLPALTLKDIHGNLIALEESAPATVIALTSVTCPVNKLYGPSLARLEQQFSKKGVRFVFVNPTPSEKAGDIESTCKRLGLKGPYVHDKSQQVINAIGAKSTAEMFLFDKRGELAYRGAMDDQYGIGTSLEKPRNNYLVKALESVLAGKTPKIARTDAPGCVLHPSAMQPEKVVTFTKDVSRILQRNCVTCHRDGGLAPFGLENYADVRDRAPMIKYVVEKGIMPPWFAKEEPHGKSPWKNDRTMAPSDRNALMSWIENGTPEGDRKDAPAKMQFKSEWAIGTPDLIVQIPKPIKVKAEGIMNYQNVYVPVTSTENKWVSGLEVRPTDPSVVHHVLIFVIPKPESGVARKEIDDTAGFFAAYVPGNNLQDFPDGLAKLLPAGCTLRFQIHYTPNGKATEDQLRLGLRYAKSEPKSEVHTIGVASFALAIPPGDPNYKISAQVPIPRDVQVLAFFPHMHVRGKAARFDLISSDGNRETLLDVPRYDFNWQLGYEYAKPRNLKRGDKLEYTAWYDNSKNNPANPDPTKTVRWGDQTYDEMMLGYVSYIVPGLKPGEDPKGMIGGVAVSFIENAFKRFDPDGDGKVSRSEFPNKALFDRLDTNKDGIVTLDEAKAALGGG